LCGLFLYTLTGLNAHLESVTPSPSCADPHDWEETSRFHEPVSWDRSILGDPLKDGVHTYH